MDFITSPYWNAFWMPTAYRASPGRSPRQCPSPRGFCWPQSFQVRTYLRSRASALHPLNTRNRKALRLTALLSASAALNSYLISKGLPQYHCLYLWEASALLTFTKTRWTSRLTDSRFSLLDCERLKAGTLPAAPYLACNTGCTSLKWLYSNNPEICCILPAFITWWQNVIHCLIPKTNFTRLFYPSNDSNPEGSWHHPSPDRSGKQPWPLCV